MDKNIKITIIMLFVTILLLAIIIFIGVNYNGKRKENEPKKEIIPKITEQYTSVSLKTLKEYDNYLNYENGEILYYNDNNMYLVYKNGVFYDNKLLEENVNGPYIHSLKKYTINIDYSEDQYSITEKSTNKTENYDSITLVMNNDEEIGYLILEKETDEKNEIYLLNVNNGNKINLVEKDISTVINNNDEGTIITDKFDYLPVISTYEKCGLISYDGTQVIDFIYDWIEYVNKDFIIVTKNNKEGVVNYKNENILDTEYDYIEKVGQYTFVVKDHILDILNDKYEKIVENIGITDIEDYLKPYNYSAILYKNNLIYVIVEGVNNTLYRIENNSIKQINSEGIGETVNDHDDNLVYFAFRYEKDGKLIYDIYDKTLKKIYTIDKALTENVEYSTSINPIKDKPNYYQIIISYYVDERYDNIYLDMKNLKELTEYDALRKFFKNGYSYVINDNKLKIYKESELLQEFTGNYEYIDEYKFIKYSENSTTEIIEVEFKKESREVEQQ